MRLRLVLLVTACLVAMPASAQALTLKADRPDTGWIRLAVPDAGNATTVALDERTSLGTSGTDWAPVNGALVVRHAAQWRCDRLKREFTATATYPDGSTQTATAQIRTPSCAKRFAVRLRNLPGRIRLTVRDRWKLGDTTAPVCVRRPGARVRCRGLPIGRRKLARRDVSTRKGGGIWRIGVGAAARVVYVRPPGALRLLATGDSMIQIVDTYLKERLAKRRIHVRSDARISTGLSKPFLLNWPKHAKKQARRIRPDVTVVAVGANDGFSFGSVDCCGQRWVDAYAKRVEAMMRAYSRGGRGLVYWLTLPAPRPAQWRSIYPAVNRAIKRAAAKFGGAVRVVDVARTFTPHFRFRQSMVWHGHRQNVRAPDGVHLSPTGASIEESLVERALRRDGAL
jgi:lysophospholipase L1-like esterase